METDAYKKKIFSICKEVLSPFCYPKKKRVKLKLQMFQYREFAGNRTFRCAKCERKKRVKYVPVSDLCGRCAARKAAEANRSVSDIPVALAENLVLTKKVADRLESKARSAFPPSRKEMVLSEV